MSNNFIDFYSVLSESSHEPMLVQDYDLDRSKSTSTRPLSPSSKANQATEKRYKVAGTFFNGIPEDNVTTTTNNTKKVADDTFIVDNVKLNGIQTIFTKYGLKPTTTASTTTQDVNIEERNRLINRITENSMENLTRDMIQLRKLSISISNLQLHWDNNTLPPSLREKLTMCYPLPLQAEDVDMCELNNKLQQIHTSYLRSQLETYLSSAKKMESRLLSQFHTKYETDDNILELYVTETSSLITSDQLKSSVLEHYNIRRLECIQQLFASFSDSDSQYQQRIAQRAAKASQQMSKESSKPDITDLTSSPTTSNSASSPPHTTTDVSNQGAPPAPPSSTTLTESRVVELIRTAITEVIENFIDVQKETNKPLFRNTQPRHTSKGNKKSPRSTDSTQINNLTTKSSVDVKSPLLTVTVPSDGRRSYLDAAKTGMDGKVSSRVATFTPTVKDSHHPHHPQQAAKSTITKNKHPPPPHFQQGSLPDRRINNAKGVRDRGKQNKRN